MSDFADLIRQAVPDDSRREIARKTGVAPETINRIMRDEGDPDAATVDKIALALKIDVQKAREAVAKPRGEVVPYTPPAEANLLSDHQRRLIDEVIRAIVATRGAGYAVEDDEKPRTSGTAKQSEKTSDDAKEGPVARPGDLRGFREEAPQQDGQVEKLGG